MRVGFSDVFALLKLHTMWWGTLFIIWKVIYLKFIFYLCSLLDWMSGSALCYGCWDTGPTMKEMVGIVHHRCLRHSIHHIEVAWQTCFFFVSLDKVHVHGFGLGWYSLITLTSSCKTNYINNSFSRQCSMDLLFGELDLDNHGNGSRTVYTSLSLPFSE